VCNSTQTVLDMRVPSRKVCSTAGARCLRLTETYTWENGRMTRPLARVLSTMLPKASGIKDSGSMTHSMVMARKLGTRDHAQNTQASSIRERSRVKEDSNGPMEAIMRVNLWMVSSKATESTILQM
jgi:hypothetical protein